MRRWMDEDWQFEVVAIRGEAKNCRIGLEAGDRFVFQYACPADFCPRVMTEIYTWCEVIRCGGNFTFRGCAEPYEMELECPCRSLTFRLKAVPINRDESGAYIGKAVRPE